jgi:hypothetical protein
MSQVSGGTTVGSFFLKWEHESYNGFVREYEGRFLVCLPTLLFSAAADDRLYEVVADCRDRELADLVLARVQEKEHAKAGT